MIETGSEFPHAAMKIVDEHGVIDVQTADVFGKGRTVLFSLPGAFTPTCSADHLPGYIAAADALKAKGIDRIVCLTVNDHHVVKAWAESSGAMGIVTFIADGAATLSKALGIEKDMAGTMGVRAIRSAMLIKDGIVEATFTENQPGIVTSTGAAAILDVIN